MTTVKAHLEAFNQKQMSIELDVDEQLTIGHAREGAQKKPDCDLGMLLSNEVLEGVAVEHAILTYTDGDFRLATVDENETWIGKYSVTPGHFLRVVDGDLLRFGAAEFTFHIEKLGKAPSAVTSASVEE